MKIIKKILSVIWNVIWYTVVLLLAVTLVNVAMAKKNHQAPQIAGYSIFRIATGSMEPTIPTGTYILTHTASPGDLRRGEIITYYSQDPAIKGIPNTHRIAAVKRAPDGSLSFVTRGDNNMKDDELPVSEDQIIGRYDRSLTRLTQFVNFFMQESVLAGMMLLQGICAVLMSLYTRHLKKKSALEKQEAEKALEEKKRALIEAEIDRLRREDLQKAESRITPETASQEEDSQESSQAEDSQEPSQEEDARKSAEEEIPENKENQEEGR